MTAPIGELVVRRVNGRPVVERADHVISVSRELLAEIDVVDGHFQIGTVRYRLGSPDPENRDAVLCERVA